MKYRADIDGLRAIAVLAVVLFHADFAFFSGGFIGVDVFFVISGYLITLLIATEIKEGRFSLIGFYERRARRILPALFAVILVSFAVAPFALPPNQFGEFGESAIAATLFFSNFLFWQETGYFDAPADFKPLLHTWSLAVEEQFYIFYPLALILIARFAGGRWRGLIIAFAIVSFAMSYKGVAVNPAAAFYHPVGRTWELLLGAMLAFRVFPEIGNQLLRETAAIVGIGLIGWGVFTFDNGTSFPGTNALFPCVGAALLIHSGAAGSSFVNRLMGMRILVFVGLISYSLYLWHWPALAFTRSFMPRELTGIETAGIVLISIAAATLSWRFIEQPFRGAKSIVRRNALFTGVGGFAALIVVVGVSVASVNSPSHENATLAEAQNAPGQFFGDDTCFLGRLQKPESWQAHSCFLNEGGGPNALLWGDSFAAHLAPGLRAAEGAWSHNILQYTAEGCAPVFGWDPIFWPNCTDFNVNVLEVIKAFDIETVILAGQWASIFNQGVVPADIGGTIEILKSRGVKVILFGQTPVFRSNVHWLAARGKYTDSAPGDFDVRINEDILQNSAGAAFVDPLPFFCNGANCRFRSESYSLFGDANHLSVFGSSWLIEQLAPRLDGVL